MTARLAKRATWFSEKGSPAPVAHQAIAKQSAKKAQVIC